ncbi:hypothetical protein [Lentilactobacillus sp. SPB1-3]|uniref:Uncharacterized protein n=1 Tax=Lentilactobacillus terminaliae TaxID=3003483 RepID=A0ACD5DCJ7_9LACO|nr:hypothetical protein [Lentilactobacillus sp. SPB1-3]MCZ0978100.1 hypothetical protein [Lentilactobacillus sp. SPB1-3]
MKIGENLLLNLIDQRINAAVSGLKTIYLGRIISTSPLTVQPKALDDDGSKKMPVRDCRQLDFEYYIKGSEDNGHARELANGDEVVVAVFADSIENYTKGKDFREDPNRRNSVDSSIILGVIK